jgi:hypothetical protein
MTNRIPVEAIEPRETIRVYGKDELVLVWLAGFVAGSIGATLTTLVWLAVAQRARSRTGSEIDG